MFKEGRPKAFDGIIPHHGFIDANNRIRLSNNGSGINIVWEELDALAWSFLEKMSALNPYLITFYLADGYTTWIWKRALAGMIFWES